MTVLTTFCFATAAQSQGLSNSTKHNLEKLKLPASTLDGLEKELAVPPQWIEAARKNPTLRIIGEEEPNEQAEVFKPFQERYPFIQIEYQRAPYNGRVLKPLVSFEEGRYLTEVVQGTSRDSNPEYARANASENLRDLPAWSAPIDGATDPDGLWAGFRTRPFCIGYNPTLVKKEQLPKTWDEVLTTKGFEGGRLGLGNLPDVYLLQLWGDKGQAWGTKYLDDLFNKLHAQLRNEGLNAGIALVAAGEINAFMPTHLERVKQLQEAKAPIEWHCPDPIPVNISMVAVLRGSPAVDAAKIYTNWLLSKEGQIAQLAAFGMLPIHRDLQFLNDNVSSEFHGKRLIYPTGDTRKTVEQLMGVWNPLALSNKK